MNNRRVVNGINTVVLHGKDYIEVVERLKILHELKKELEVIESQPFQFGDRCIWRVTILVDGKRYVGNAEAKLTNAKPGSPDASNPFECAETSALGRCLAFAGLGTLESIASYDEIARGQPHTTIVEAETPRLPAPKTSQNGHPVEQASAQTRQNGQQAASKDGRGPSDGESVKSRLNALYMKAQETGAIEKGLPKQEGAAAFLEWAGKVLEANVASVGQLTASRLDMLDAFLTLRYKPVNRE